MGQTNCRKTECSNVVVTRKKCILPNYFGAAFIVLVYKYCNRKHMIQPPFTMMRTIAIQQYTNCVYSTFAVTFGFTLMDPYRYSRPGGLSYRDGPHTEYTI